MTDERFMQLRNWFWFHLYLNEKIRTKLLFQYARWNRSLVLIFSFENSLMILISFDYVKVTEKENWLRNEVESGCARKLKSRHFPGNTVKQFKWKTTGINPADQKVISVFFDHKKSWYWFSNVCASAKVGIDTEAPFLVTAHALAAVAIARQSRADLPANLAARKKPVNVSPAPTVSTTSTGQQEAVTDKG